MKKITTEEIYLAAVRSDLKVFVQHAFATIYPGKQFMDNWHVDAIIYQLELAIEGKQPRLIINLPPRHLKSFLVSVALPAFILGMDPSAKIICVSYSDELTKTLARDFRRILESDWYQGLFPNVQVTKLTETDVVTDQGGFRYATSVGGSLTGKGADFLIIDDPMKPEDALSDKTREKTNEWFKSTLFSRLEDKKHSVLILVMQRLHVNDLTGFVQSNGNYHKLSLPAISTRHEEVPLNNEDVYYREEGEPLHEERESLATLEETKSQVSPQHFQSQYQQSPETPEGAMFKRRWFNIIDSYPSFDGGEFVVSIDAASSTSESANYSAITVMYAASTGYYVIETERGRWDYEGLLGKAKSYVRKYGARVQFIVEAASNGTALISSLRIHGAICTSYFPKEDKTTRASYVMPAIHGGHVSILRTEDNKTAFKAYMDEVCTFPNSRNDDQVDSLVMSIMMAERMFGLSQRGSLI